MEYLGPSSDCSSCLTRSRSMAVVTIEAEWVCGRFARTPRTHPDVTRTPRALDFYVLGGSHLAAVSAPTHITVSLENRSCTFLNTSGSFRSCSQCVRTSTVSPVPVGLHNWMVPRATWS